MPGKDAAVAYRQAFAYSSSPAGLIVSLYDAILRDFRRALAALDAGNVQDRVSAMNHAVTVIGHLEEILDHKRGGEAAKQFQQLYHITRGMIVQANAQSSRALIDNLIEMYSPLRQAWQVAEQKLRASEPQALLSPKIINPARIAVPAGAPGTDDAPRKNWNA